MWIQGAERQTTLVQKQEKTYISLFSLQLAIKSTRRAFFLLSFLYLHGLKYCFGKLTNWVTVVLLLPTLSTLLVHLGVIHFWRCIRIFMHLKELLFVRILKSPKMSQNNYPSSSKIGVDSNLNWHCLTHAKWSKIKFLVISILVSSVVEYILDFISKYVEILTLYVF